MDMNPIHHASPAKNMKCSFMDFVQLLIISRAGQWTRTPSANPLQPKKWNAHFCFTINFWFRPDWSMDSNPIHHPSPTNKMKCLFLDYTQLLMIGWAGWWTQTHPPPLFSQKMKSSFLDYVQLLMISLAGWWTRTPSATPLQPIKWNAHFWITFTLDDRPGWSMDSNPIHHPSPANKMKCYFLDYVQLLMISCSCQWAWTPSTTCLQPKKWNAHILIMFTSDDWSGWSMDSNPICHPSPAKKMKCSFLYYVQLLMLPRLVNGLKPHPPPLSSQ